jgi:subtilisin-like proprotein convertase family protein
MGAADQVYAIGISAQGFSTGSLIARNTIRVENFISSSVTHGIAVGNVVSSGTGIIIDRNNIERALSSNTGGYGVRGIDLNVGSGNTVRNNFVRNVNNGSSTSFTTGFGAFGIRVSAGSGHSVIHNTVHMAGVNPGAGSGLVAALGITLTSSTGLDVRNNILSNVVTGSGASSAHVCLYLPSSGTSAMNLLLNNNIYYSGTTVGLHGILQVGTTYGSTNLYSAANFSAGSTTPSTNSRSYTSTLSSSSANDGGSMAFTTAAPFLGATDLHINPNVASPADAAGAALGVTDDFDGETRSALTPVDIGADAYVALAQCAAYSAPADGATDQLQTGVTLSWSAATNATSYDVFFGTDNPPTNLVNGTNQAGTSYATGTLAASQTYYWRVLPRNAQNAASGCTSIRSFTTQAAAPTLTTAPASLGFGSACLGTVSGDQTFTMNALNLTGTTVTVTAPTDFTVSEDNITYASSITVAHSSGAFTNKTIYVKFAPTVLGAYSGNVVISDGGLSPSVNVAVTGTGVNSLAGLSYSAGAPVYCTGNAITSNTAALTTTGGTVTYSVSPALPAGLALNASTGAITGTPTAAVAAANYTITASNGCSSTTSTVNITVLQGMAGLTYSSATMSLCQNVAATTNTVSTVTGGGTITYSVSPALPAGLSLDATTGAISGTPTVTAGAASYTVTATNSCSSTTSAVTITVSAALGGTYTVGSGGNYGTLTAAVAAYNASCLNGAVVFSLTDANYSTGETFPISINANASASANNTLTIRPAAGQTSTISGGSASGALLRLNGADWVIIDGSNSGGTDRSLTITNTTTTSAVINLISLGTGAGATNNTIRNCNLNAASGSTSYGIHVGGGTLGTGGADNDNVTIQNNAISAAPVGIYVNGTASASAGGCDNLVIADNSISYTGSLTGLGIRSGNALNASIRNNAVSVETSAAGYPVGISLETGLVSSMVTGNRITKVLATNTFGYGCRGITVGTGTASSNLTIANNFIAGVNGSNWTSMGNSTMGIAIGIIGNSTTVTTTCGGINLYHNSVNLDGNYVGTSTTTGKLTAALYIGSGASALDVRNNILRNALNNTTAVAKNYAIHSAAANTVFTSINHNNYVVSGTQGVLGFLGADRTTLAALATAFGGNANSVSIAPTFTSTTDLHLPVDPANIPLDNLGGAGTGITVDIDGETRSATPDIGADEFSIPICSGTPVAGTSSVAGGANGCVNGTKTFGNTGADVGNGISYQWQVATSSGGPYSNVSGGTGATTTSYTTGPLTAGTYFYVIQVSCSFSGQNTLSNEVTLTAAQPTVLVNGVTAATGAYCMPGGSAVTLNASGANTYSWTPATGLSATTGASVNATPSATTTYTVTGTDANGCTNTATAAVSAATTPQNATATATPATICAGTTTDLAASAFVPNTSAPVNQYTFSASSGTFTALSGSTATTLVSNVDDDISSAFGIGFSFVFGGNSYTQVQATSNGVLLFGTGRSGTNSNDLATAVTAQRPGVAALWDDLQCTSGVTYQLSGTAPSRVLTVQWLNMEWSYSANAAVISFQVKLYEGTNAIECIYRQEAAGVNTVAGGASIGLMGTSSSDYISLQNTSASPTISTSASTNNITAKPATGQVYRFAPPGLTLAYAWDPAASVASPNSQNTATNALSSTTTFTVTASNNGCTATATATVSVDPLVCGNLTTAGAACVGTRTVTANPGAGGTPYSYAWTEDGQPFGGNTQTINATVGTHTYECTVTDNCGSSCTSSLSVTTNALPTVLVNGVAAAAGNYCTPAGPAVSLAATGASTYAWTPATGLDASTGTSVNASPSATTTYTVTGTDANGCVNMATAAVNVAATPQGVGASATPATICSGNTSTLTATALTSVAAYELQSLAGTWTALTGGTAVGLTGGTTTTDEGFANSLPIGFSFTFNGVSYDRFGVSANGWMTLGNGSTAITSGAASNNLANGTQRPIIAPLWDDMDVSAVGNVTYSTSGTVGSRVLTVQWNQVKWYYLAASAGIAFQARLYEGTNHIEFQYNQLGGALNSASASIGIAGTATGAGNFLSLNGTGTSPSASSTTETTNLNAKPATGQIYRLTPQNLTYSWSPSASVVSSSSASTATTALTTAQTYTVSVTNNGCSATASATVAIATELTEASITGTLAYCTGGSTTLTAVATGGTSHTYQWTGPSGPAGTAATQVANTPGTWSVAITSCGVTQNASVTVVQNALPTVAISPASATYCAGGSAVALAASGANTYGWAPAAGLNATTGTNVNASPASSTTYTVTGTDGNGCQNTATTTITYGGVTPLVQSVTATPATVCAGVNSSLNVTAGTVVNNPPAGGSISIPTTLGSASPYPSTIAVSGLTGAVSNVRVTITNLAHDYPSDIDMVLFGPTGAHSIIFTDAIGTASVTNRTYTFQTGATVLPLTGSPASGTYGVVNGSAWSGTGTPSAVNNTGLGAFNGTDPNGTWSLYVYDDVAQDGGSIGSWSLQITTGAAVSTYSWTPDTYLSSTSVQSPTATNPQVTTAYTVTASTATGCSATGNVTLNVNALPTVTCPANITGICSNAAAFALSGGSPAGGTYSGPGVSSGSFDPATAGVGVHTITYSYTDGNGCSNTCTFTITVNALPVVTCPGNSSVCVSAAAFALSGGSPAGGIYSGTGVSSGNFDPAAAGVGTHTITYSYTDGNSCSNSCTFTILVNALPTVSCPADISGLCSNGAAIALTGGSPAGGTYSGPGVSGGSFDPAVAGAGTHTITYTYTDANGCSNTCTFTISVNAAPTISCGGPYGPVCLNGGPIELNGSPGTGSWSGPGVEGTTFFPGPAGLGTWTLTYTVPGANGCTSTCTTSITVTPAVFYYVDADGDGAGDADASPLPGCTETPGYVTNNTDACDNDPLKLSPGQCGCGVADTDSDGDAVADCNDNCPADPAKSNPGTCGCGVADTDTDGDSFADCVDGCPNDPNKIGPGACGCGNPDVDSDGDGALNCNDACPNDPNKAASAGSCGCGNPEPGAACNDGNPNTTGDVVNASCQCVGTPAGNLLNLTITTDNNGGTSWEIIPLGSNTPACTGSGYGPNTTTVASCTVPDGCYELRVFDAGGDGMCCLNGLGGYVLRTSANERIVDAAQQGIFSSTAAIALGQGFCVPLSTDRLTSSRCDREDYLPGDFIQAVPNNLVRAQYDTGTPSDDGYQFWFFNPNGGYTRRILITHATNNYWFPSGADRCSYLKLDQIVTNPLPLNTLLNVRVRIMVNGVYSAFGPACRFKLDLSTNCPLTQLVSTPGPQFSCGRTGVMLNGATTLYAVPVASANRYQFEFSRQGYLRRIASSSTALTLTNWNTLPLQYSRTYNVRVRASFDNGASYCPFGPTCTISTQANTDGMAQQTGTGSIRMADNMVEPAFTMYPNPNQGPQLFVSLSNIAAEVNMATVDLYDLFGKRVMTATLPMQDGLLLNNALELNSELAAGLYLVTITAGDFTTTERLVIQR